MKFIILSTLIVINTVSFAAATDSCNVGYTLSPEPARGTGRIRAIEGRNIRAEVELEVFTASKCPAKDGLDNKIDCFVELQQGRYGVWHGIRSEQVADINFPSCRAPHYLLIPTNSQIFTDYFVSTITIPVGEPKCTNQSLSELKVRCERTPSVMMLKEQLNTRVNSEAGLELQGETSCCVRAE